MPSLVLVIPQRLCFIVIDRKGVSLFIKLGLGNLFYLWVISHRKLVVGSGWPVRTVADQF